MSYYMHAVQEFAGAGDKVSKSVSARLDVEAPTHVSVADVRARHLLPNHIHAQVTVPLGTNHPEDDIPRHRLAVSLHAPEVFREGTPPSIPRLWVVFEALDELYRLGTLGFVEPYAKRAPCGHEDGLLRVEVRLLGVPYVGAVPYPTILDFVLV